MDVPEVDDDGAYDPNITSIESPRAVINYIHADPVRRELAATLEDSEWTSARWYAGLRPAKLEMDKGMFTVLARG